MKLFVKYIAAAKRMNITPISGRENSRLKIPHITTIILVLLIHFLRPSTGFKVLLSFFTSFKNITPHSLINNIIDQS